ncbi:MAG: hypothetical protein ACKVVT_07600 [Dehalococcoidia bacterium]
MAVAAGSVGAGAGVAASGVAEGVALDVGIGEEATAVAVATADVTVATAAAGGVPSVAVADDDAAVGPSGCAGASLPPHAAKTAPNPTRTKKDEAFRTEGG